MVSESGFSQLTYLNIKLNRLANADPSGIYCIQLGVRGHRAKRLRADDTLLRIRPTIPGVCLAAMDLDNVLVGRICHLVPLACDELPYMGGLAPWATRRDLVALVGEHDLGGQDIDTAIGDQLRVAKLGNGEGECWYAFWDYSQHHYGKETLQHVGVPV